MIVEAIVEIPKNSQHKYEIKNGVLVLDRVINQPIPHNYGYIPNTLCEDGDALDIFIVSYDPIYPNAKVYVEILSGLECLDKGLSDNKIIGTLVGNDFIYDPKVSIEHYLTTYKKDFVIKGSFNKEQAIDVYLKSKI